MTFTCTSRGSTNSSPSISFFRPTNSRHSTSSRFSPPAKKTKTCNCFFYGLISMPTHLQLGDGVFSPYIFWSTCPRSSYCEGLVRSRPPSRKTVWRSPTWWNGPQGMGSLGGGRPWTLETTASTRPATRCSLGLSKRTEGKIDFYFFLFLRLMITC